MKSDELSMEISSYLTTLSIDGISEICSVSGEDNCLTISEIIESAGYDPKSILNRRLLITIEDEI